MTTQNSDKSTAVKLNDSLIRRIDALAKNCGMVRGQLMIIFIELWLDVLDKSEMSHMFYIANLLRVHKAQMNGEFGVYEHEFSGSGLPEKPIPVKFSESVLFRVSCHADKCNLSRHQMMKTMVIVGIEELEKIVLSGFYQYEQTKPKLYKTFSSIMACGFKAFKAFIK